MDEAVGAAKTHRNWLSASSGRGGCFQTKSIMTPSRLVTVTPPSRRWSTHRLALNFGRTTSRAPAIRAGYAAMNWALPWNSGVTVRYVSSAVSLVSDTTSSPKKYICACGIATPLDGPVVPDVKKTDARLRGDGSGSSTRGPDSRSSHGAAAQPAVRNVASAVSRDPVSIT